MFRKHAIKEEVDPAYVSNSVTLINYNTSFNISLVTWKINITATDEKISKYSHEMKKIAENTTCIYMKTRFSFLEK